MNAQELHNLISIGTAVQTQIVSELVISLGSLQHSFKDVKHEEWIRSRLAQGQAEEWLGVNILAVQIEHKVESVKLLITVLQTQKSTQYFESGVILSVALGIQEIVGEPVKMVEQHSHKELRDIAISPAEMRGDVGKSVHCIFRMTIRAPFEDFNQSLFSQKVGDLMHWDQELALFVLIH
jgi:hypothetical protein